MSLRENNIRSLLDLEVGSVLAAAGIGVKAYVRHLLSDPPRILAVFGTLSDLFPDAGRLFGCGLGQSSVAYRMPYLL